MQEDLEDEVFPDKRRFALWNYLGLALIVALVLVVFLVISKFNDSKAQAIARAREIAEANRPIDAVNVALIRLEKTKIIDAINLPGLLQAWDKAQLSAQVSGKLLKKVSEGTRVEKDGSILYLDQRDYEIKLVQAKAAFEEAQQNYLRKQKLRSSMVNALSELEQATATFNKTKSEYEAAQLALERCIIRAPFAGVVDVVGPEVGELVTAGQNVATVAQLGELKVEIGIPEKDIDMVRNVSECEVLVEAAGVKTIGARTYLSYLPADDSQVYVLRLKLQNNENKLRPGMFGNVRVVREIRDNFLTPIYAVMAKDDKHYVFVADAYTPVKGAKNDPRQLRTARKKEVTLGVIQGSNIEVVSGLAQGDELVVVGQRNLDDGTIMNIAKVFGSMSELSQ